MHQKAIFLCKKENSAFLAHACQINYTIGWNDSKITTTNSPLFESLVHKLCPAHLSHGSLTLNCFTRKSKMQDVPENHFWVSGTSWVNINK